MYINQSENKKLRESDFQKYNAVGKELGQLRNQVSSGKCAAHAQNVLGVDDVSSAMSGLTVKSKKVRLVFCSILLCGH
jgi:hypothetical protein